MFTQCSFMRLKGGFEQRRGPPAGGMRGQPLRGDGPKPGGSISASVFHFRGLFWGGTRVLCVGALTS